MTIAKNTQRRTTRSMTGSLKPPKAFAYDPYSRSDGGDKPVYVTDNDTGTASDSDIDIDIDSDIDIDIDSDSDSDSDSDNGCNSSAAETMAVWCRFVVSVRALRDISKVSTLKEARDIAGNFLDFAGVK